MASQKREKIVQELIDKIKKSPLWGSDADQTPQAEKLDNLISQVVDKLKFTYSEAQEIITNTPLWSKTREKMISIREAILKRTAVQLQRFSDSEKNAETYNDIVDYLKEKKEKTFDSVSSVLDVFTGACGNKKTA